MMRWNSFGFFFTFVGSMPICRSRASTAEASWASISPERTSPCFVFPDHLKTGVCRGADGAGAGFCLMAAAWAMVSSLRPGVAILAERRPRSNRRAPTSAPSPWACARSRSR